MASETDGRADGDPLPSGRAAGVAIALASLLSVAFMATHPTVHAREPADFVAAVGRRAVVNGVVHGSLIALVAVLVCGLSCLASRLGMNSVWVRAGLVAYGLGAIAEVAAALVNGFIVP